MELKAKDLLPHFFTEVATFLDLGYQFENGNHYFNGVLCNGRDAYRTLNKAANDLGYCTHLNEEEDTYTIYTYNCNFSECESYRNFESETITEVECVVRFKQFLHPNTEWEESDFLESMYNLDQDLKGSEAWVEIESEIKMQFYNRSVDYSQDLIQIEAL